MTQETGTHRHDGQRQDRLDHAVDLDRDDLGLEADGLRLEHDAHQQHAENLELREHLDPVHLWFYEGLLVDGDREEEEGDDRCHRGLGDRAAANEPDQAGKDQLARELDDLPVPAVQSRRPKIDNFHTIARGDSMGSV